MTQAISCILNSWQVQNRRLFSRMITCLACQSELFKYDNGKTQMIDCFNSETINTTNELQKKRKILDPLLHVLTLCPSLFLSKIALGKFLLQIISCYF